MIKYPKGYSVNLLIIPIKQFKAMIDAFSKCKKVSILIRFHSNNVKDITGREIKGRPGLVITTEGTSQSGRIFEKFGEVPDEENTQALNPTSSLKIDESSIVRVTNSSYPTFEIEKIPEPNEYIIGADKIEIFSKLSSMHNEGSVRIRYLEGYHLHIAYRFGAFGECEICLYNPHVK